MGLLSAILLALLIMVTGVLVAVILRSRRQVGGNAAAGTDWLTISGIVGNYQAPTAAAAGTLTIAGTPYTITPGAQVTGANLLTVGQRVAVRGALDANGHIANAEVTSGIRVPLEIYILELAYLVVLLTGAVLFNDRTGAYYGWKLLHLLPDPVGPIPLAIPWYGALGAVTVGLFGLFRHADSWDDRYLNWHIARPLTGATLGILAFLIFLVVIDATGAEARKAGHPEFVYYLVAFIVGFREETFTTLIQRAADLFIGPGNTTGAQAGNQ